MVKQFCLKTASGIAAAVMLFALPQSCVNEEYDISKIDTTVSFGGEALVFPLGSTARLTLKTLLPEEDFDYITSQLQGQDEGVYGFSMSGEMNDLGDAIPDISEMLSIADMEVNPEPIEYELNYNMDGMKIDETVFPEPDGTGSNPGEISFDSLKDMPDLDEMMPTEPIEGPSVTVETAKYYPTEDQLDMSAHFPEVRVPETDYITLYNLVSLKSAVDLLPVRPDETIGSESIPSEILEDLANIGLGEERFVKVNLHVEMPEGISDISNVSFGENAEMTVTTTVNNSFLTGGSIVPHITISGLGNLVLIDDPAFSASSDGGALDLSGLALEVDEASPSTVISDSQTYRLAGLPDLPWNGNILDMTDQKITVDGYLSIQDVKTTKNMIGAPALGDFSNAYSRNSSIEESRTRQTYVFSSDDGRLLSAEIDAMLLGMLPRTILRLEAIDYDAVITQSDMEVPQGFEWIDDTSEGRSRLAESLPVGDYDGIAADEAVRRMFSAMASWDERSLGVILRSRPLRTLEEKWSGCELLECGRPFTSGQYAGVFVPCKVRFADGKTGRGRKGSVLFCPPHFINVSTDSQR